MHRTGSATSPLHGGHCPPWLFTKMKELGAAIVEAMIVEYGTLEVLQRFSDPVWFQAFGSTLGFDWHSSGLTTVVLGALKEGLAPKEHELGLYMAGGKGRTARKTPTEINDKGSRFALANTSTALIYASKMAAKVDSAAVQDGYQLYHHVMLFDAEGHWAVIQQGMHNTNHMARRYHWLDRIPDTFTRHPHQAVVGAMTAEVFDLTESANWPIQDASLELSQYPDQVLQQLRHIEEHPDGHRDLLLPRFHAIPSSRHIDTILRKVYEEANPKSFEDLLGLSGVGASTIRALSMVAEVIHGTHPTFHDPVRYSFAHGGKDGFPYPVNRHNYDTSIATLRQAIERARLQDHDKMQALKRLSSPNASALEQKPSPR